MSSQYLTISQAAKLANVSEITVRRKVKDNELAYTKNNTGQYLIDKESLLRVYKEVRFDKDGDSQGVVTHDYTEVLKPLVDQITYLNNQFRDTQKLLLSGQEEKQKKELEYEGKLNNQRFFYERKVHNRNIVLLLMLFLVIGLLIFIFVIKY